MDLVDRLHERIAVTDIFDVQDLDKSTNEALGKLLEFVKKAFVALQNYADALVCSGFINYIATVKRLNEIYRRSTVVAA